MLYIVVQEPKAQWRQALVIRIRMLEAASEAAALRAASVDLPPNKDYKKLTAYRGFPDVTYLL